MAKDALNGSYRFRIKLQYSINVLSAYALQVSFLTRIYHCNVSPDTQEPQLDMLEVSIRVVLHAYSQEFIMLMYAS